MTPSRERFELGLFDAVMKKAELPTIRPNDWVQHTFDWEKLNVTVIPREQVYFDTTNAGPQLAEYTQKAGEQNETVLAIFHKASKPLSPSQVLEWWRSVPSGCGKPLPPLTSIRRAITTLTQAGALVKTETKRKGVFGRNEFCWCLPEAGETASQQGVDKV